jgi:N-acetylglucosamine-6-phosphate deacetylase
MQQTLKIFDGKILTPNGIVTNGCIVACDGIISEVKQGSIEVKADVEINAGGKYVSPGFIDIHVHGGGGYDFMDRTETAFLKIAQMHARHGTTAMVPTTLTSTKKELLEIISLYEQADKKNSMGAKFLGMHLEGPYFALNQRGAQDARYIRDPDPSEYKEIIAHSSCIKRWSAAPERKGAIEFGKYLKSHGILPAIAHTDAIYEQVKEAYEIGYSLITHIYSAMSGVTRRNGYRYAGVIESAYIIDDMNVEVIADGRHLPAPLLKLIYKIKGVDKIALITDAMRAAGTFEKESVLGNICNGMKVIIEDGVAKLPDRSAFAGSIATTNKLVYNMVTLADISLLEAVKMITATPAAIMGVKNKGHLLKGMDADIILFDEALNVSVTIVKGKIIYSSL